MAVGGELRFRQTAGLWGPAAWRAGCVTHTGTRPGIGLLLCVLTAVPQGARDEISEIAPISNSRELCPRKGFQFLPCFGLKNWYFMADPSGPSLLFKERGTAAETSGHGQPNTATSTAHVVVLQTPLALCAETTPRPFSRIFLSPPSAPTTENSHCHFLSGKASGSERLSDVPLPHSRDCQSETHTSLSPFIHPCERLPCTQHSARRCR